MDLRTEKIYDALTDAMMALLKEKLFEEITVSELCQRARTRRATFYNHFSDKYEFLAFFIDRLRQEMFQQAAAVPEADSPRAYCHALIDVSLDFTESHIDLLQSLENSAAGSGMLMNISYFMKREQASKRPHVYKVPPALEDELTTQFFIGGMNQCSRWWIAHRSTVDKAAMRARLHALADRLLDAPASSM
ncbi:MAG: TetR/AcrR family transcriptional regulator [Pseudoramibacter sp.]